MADENGLSEELLLRRLEAFEQTRRFFIDMWLQNPALAAQAGSRIQALLKPLTYCEPAKGEGARPR
jgi:hypothetical protein